MYLEKTKTPIQARIEKIVAVSQRCDQTPFSDIIQAHKEFNLKVEDYADLGFELGLLELRDAIQAGDNHQISVLESFLEQSLRFRREMTRFHQEGIYLQNQREADFFRGVVCGYLIRKELVLDHQLSPYSKLLLNFREMEQALRDDDPETARVYASMFTKTSHQTNGRSSPHHYNPLDDLSGRYLRAVQPELEYIGHQN